MAFPSFLRDARNDMAEASKLTDTCVPCHVCDQSEMMLTVLQSATHEQLKIAIAVSTCSPKH